MVNKDLDIAPSPAFDPRDGIDNDEREGNEIHA